MGENERIFLFEERDEDFLDGDVEKVVVGKFKEGKL